MRLLFVTQDFPPDVGGIQTYSYELARRLARYASEFLLVAPMRPGARSIDRRLGFEVLRLPAPSSYLALPALAALPAVARRRRADVAFHAQWLTATASLRARRLTGHPSRIAAAVHGRETLYNPFARAPVLGGAFERRRRSTIAALDHLFPVSHNTARLAAEIGASMDRQTVIHNGTDPETFFPMDVSDLKRRLGLEGKKIIIGIGRLIPRKGFDTTIRALPAVGAEVPDVAYVVVGDGPDRSRLERLADSLGVRQRVHLLGSVAHAEVSAYYNLGDVYALPAREEPPSIEGFPIVFMEANACGIPVIGARSAGIPDAIEDGRTGFLVDPDDPSDLAAALLRLLTNPEMAARMGQAGRDRVVRKFTWDHAADSIYEGLVALLE